MFIRIESSSGMPITRQIMDQVRTHCAGGSLCPGDRLPSVRQLAQQLAVNQYTILRVYERLTAEGLLERRHGDGTFVADRLPAGRLKAEREILEQEALRLAQHASQLDLSAADVHELVDDSFDALKKKRKPGGNSHE